MYSLFEYCISFSSNVYQTDDYIGLDSLRETRNLDHSDSSSEQSSDDDEVDDGTKLIGSNTVGEDRKKLRSKADSDQSEYSLSEEESDLEDSKPNYVKNTNVPSIKSVESTYSSNNSLSDHNIRKVVQSKPSPVLGKDTLTTAKSKSKLTSTDRNNHLFESVQISLGLVSELC